MGLFKKKYEIIKDGPKEIEWDEYFNVAMNEYNVLLDTQSDDEKVFQKFFEENPCFLPGGLELFGQSGHYPYMNTVITQPVIGCVTKRIPDFMWLAQDSLTFCPVFIEIEKPNKKMFTQKNIPTAEFTQAMNQIDEWKMILNNPVNRLLFYDYYDIPQYLREKEFVPQFLLIYGRREEYENNVYLSNLRRLKYTDNVAIYSFDRLQPLSDYRQFITCKVSEQKYRVTNISPTYRYRADCAEELYMWDGFFEKIDCMKNTTKSRKTFLKDRYSYWTSFKGNPSGIIRSMEGE